LVPQGAAPALLLRARDHFHDSQQRLELPAAEILCILRTPIVARMNQSQPKNQKAELRTEVPGPESRALRAREDAHVAPVLEGYAVMAGIVVAEGRGSAVTDVDGNRYLDFIGGINVNALGHRRATVVRAIEEQVSEVSVGSSTSRARVELCERLAAAPPAPGVHRLQLYSGGAEAGESALRLGKWHNREDDVGQ